MQAQLSLEVVVVMVVNVVMVVAVVIAGLKNIYSVNSPMQKMLIQKPRALCAGKECAFNTERSKALSHKVLIAAHIILRLCTLQPLDEFRIF